MLSNPGLQNSLSTLSLLASEVNRYVDTERLRSGYVCRQCAGLLEKYEQLHKQLISNLSNAIPILPIPILPRGLARGGGALGAEAPPLR